MARLVALLWVATTVLGSPCTDEGCDNSQDSHLLQVTGKAAALQTSKVWDGVDGNMITDACTVYDGTVDGAGAKGILNQDGKLGFNIRDMFADKSESAFTTANRVINGNDAKWEDDAGCAAFKPFGDNNGNEIRCQITSVDILRCVNSYFAYLTKHRDGMSAEGKQTWGTIAGECKDEFGPTWESHSNQIKLPSSGDANGVLTTMVSSGKCGTALNGNKYFEFGTGWGDDIAAAFGVDTSVAGGDVSIVFQYPESDLDSWMSANHGLAQSDSWASQNPVFCGASGSGNIAHRCLVPGTSVGGEPVELNGDAYQAITFDDCKRQAKACESCIHTAGILESGMNGLPAMAGMWQQTFPGSPSSPNAVGKCCLYSAPCAPEFQEAPRHRQNVIANGVQTSELARIAFDLIVH